MADNSNINRFDREAHRWDSNPVRLAMTQTIAKAMVDSIGITAKDRVLDFGCGTGLISRHICSIGADIVSADTSEGMITQLKNRVTTDDIENIHPLLLDEKSIELPHSFDVIVSSMVLHHIADTEGIFSMFYQWLSPGGRIAVADLETESGAFHGSDHPVPHHGFDPEYFAKTAAACGFENCKTSSVYVVQKPNTQTGQMCNYPVFMLSAKKA